MRKRNVTKKDILSMIRDDLKGCKITRTFNGLGFENDSFELEASDTVVRLMGINTNDKRIGDFMDRYMDLANRVEHINITENPDQLDSLAMEIYNYLKSIRKTYSV